MKILKIFTFAIFIQISFLATSQSSRFGNEWINFSQEYLKITVNQNGIYRINKADLDFQLFTTSGKLLRKYKLFHRGKEIAIKVIGNPDTEIQANDFIYFYGKANDGGQDDELYKHGATRANPYFSLYSDNTAYFLTVDPINDGKRMEAAPNTNNTLISDPFYISKIIDNQINHYNHDISKSGIPGVIQSYFEPFEGMTSWPYFGRNVASSGTVTTRALNRSYPLPNFLPGTSKEIEFETKATTRRSEGKSITYTLENGAPTGSVSGTFSLGSFFTGHKLNTSISNVTGNLDVFMNTVTPFDKDLWSFFYMLIKYPTNLNFVDKKEYELVGNSDPVKRLTLTSPTTTVLGFDISDFENQKEINLINNVSNLDIYLGSNNTNNKKIYLTSIISNPVSLKKIVFNQIDQSLYDYIIISDKRLTNGATAFKNYRESPAGGSFDVHLAYIDEIFDQFSYGERTPIAIHRYSDWMTNTSKKMKYLFIIGKSISIVSQLKLYYSATTQTFSNPNLLPYPHADNPDDFVPTMGYPASDIALTSGLLGTIETVPSIPTGRLVVNTNEEIIGIPTIEDNQTIYGGYLGKVIEHRNRPNSDYQKKFAQIAGAQHGDEINSLKKALEDARAFAIAPPFSASATDYVTLNKDPLNVHTSIACSQQIGDYKNLNVDLAFYSRVNAGAGIVAYYGHGSSEEVALNFGYVSKVTNNSCTGLPCGGPSNYLDMVARDMDGNPILTNGKPTVIPKYSLFIGSGCGLSNSFFGNKDLASDWVNTPKKGSINAISNTSLSYETYDTRALLKLYQTMFGSAPSAKLSANGKTKGTNEMVDSAIGDIFKQASINNINSNSGGDPNSPNPDYAFVSNLQQTILLGDPSIAIFKVPSVTQPLSLTLLNVKAINEDKKNVITWETENEIDFNGFDIERSIDSKKFEKIGFVKGNGKSKEQNSYLFEDINPIEGLNYYRLKMMDNDGKSNYSKIVSTKFEIIGNSPIIIGNPVNGGKFNFQFNSYLENSAILNDIKGNKINIDVNAQGNNLYNVNIRKSLQKGVYILKLSNKKGEIYSRKIISE